MKLYVHYEVVSGKERTVIFKSSSSNFSINDISLFSTEKLSNEINLDDHEIVLRNIDGDILDDNNTNLNDIFDDKDDLFITLKKRIKIKSRNRNEFEESGGSPNTKSNKDTSKIQSDDPLSQKMVNQIVELFRDKKYRQVYNICKKLETSYKLMNHNKEFIMAMYCNIYHDSGQYTQAIKATKELLIQMKNHPLQYDQKLKFRQLDAYCILVDSLIALEEYDDAADYIDTYLGMNEDKKYNDEYEMNKFLKLIAGQIECLLYTGNAMEAANVLNKYVGLKESDNNIDILRIYAEIALRHGKLEEGIRGLLKAIITDNSNKRIKILFAAAIKSSQGLNELCNQLPASSRTAPALAYLATLAKDVSQFNASLELYNKAISALPDNASYALNIMHVYETMGKFDEALNEAKNFCMNNKNLKVPGLQLSDLLLLLQQDHNKDENLFNVKLIDDNNRCMIYTYPINGNNGDNLDNILKNIEKQDFSPSDLDILAIGFTIVKLLYGMGKLNILPEYFKIIEPCRQSSLKDIHETTIRNEHAYFQCIAYVLSYQNNIYDNIKSKSTLKPIYVCGDSHTIPIAWSIIKQKSTSQNRILIPKLVTGVKHWHLRNDSNFYPKANFNNVIDTIPNGSDVIFIIGEIDCREGILLAVEKMKYDNMENGIKNNIKIFTNVIKKIASNKKLSNIWIHPIAPVLEETKLVREPYSKLYKKEIQDLSNEYNIKWLDFEEELIDSNTRNLLENFNLDGTHLHPKYLELIADRI